MKDSIINLLVSCGLLLLASIFVYYIWNNQLSGALNLPQIDYGTAIMMKLLVDYHATETHGMFIIHNNETTINESFTWILANQIYDVAVDGLDDPEKIDDFAVEPITKQSVIDDVIKISSYRTTDEWKLIMRDYYWNDYEYRNT